MLDAIDDVDKALADVRHLQWKRTKARDGTANSSSKTGSFLLVSRKLYWKVARRADLFLRIQRLEHVGHSKSKDQENIVGR